ncbi:hypothetical protein [Methylobacterium sp. E-041]|uniref:hypothetical protein n=1 Tax=Methylobacterium sp. E-041 TaxID=2836573 RepID=UPI001FB92FF8|nr:hypothetical protein [Methylobacterium sp. E-041]
MYVVRPIDVVENSEFDVSPMGCANLPLARAHAAGLARWFLARPDGPKRIAIERNGAIVQELHIDKLAALDYLGLELD